jgi:hypothetical protein
MTHHLPARSRGRYLYETPADEEAVAYAVAYWHDHPEAWAAVNGDTRDHGVTQRRQTWQAVNAATEGRLAELVDHPDSLRWTFLYGFAVVEALAADL